MSWLKPFLRALAETLCMPETAAPGDRLLAAGAGPLDPAKYSDSTFGAGLAVDAHADEAVADYPCRRGRRVKLYQSPLGQPLPEAISNRDFPNGTARSDSGSSQ